MVAKDQPDYARINELDKSVRDFITPSLLLTDPTLAMEIAPRHLHMQRATVALSRELGQCCFSMGCSLRFTVCGQLSSNCTASILPKL